MCELIADLRQYRQILQDLATLRIREGSYKFILVSGHHWRGSELVRPRLFGLLEGLKCDKVVLALALRWKERKVHGKFDCFFSG